MAMFRCDGGKNKKTQSKSYDFGPNSGSVIYTDMTITFENLKELYGVDIYCYLLYQGNTMHVADRLGVTKTEISGNTVKIYYFRPSNSADVSLKITGVGV